MTCLARADEVTLAGMPSPLAPVRPRHVAWLAAALVAGVAPGACLPSYTLVEGTSTSGASGSGGGAGSSTSGSSGGGADGGCQSVACDPHNCGATGHDCLGGECLDGVCQPFTLLGGLHTPVAIALTADGVYFNDGSDIFTCAKTGCGPSGSAKQVIALAEIGVASLAVDATHLYWTTDVSPTGGVKRCLLPTCQQGTEALASMLDQPADVAVDATSLYVVAGVPSQGVVLGCPLTGCGPLNSAAQTYATNLGQPVRVVPTDTELYWTTADGHLQRCPLTGCAGSPEDVAINVNPTALTLTAGVAYFGGASGDLIICSLPACTQVVVAHTSVPAMALTVDHTHVYWSESGVNDMPTGTINRVDVAGGIGKTLASDLPAPGAMASDTTAIYWVNNGTALNAFKDGSVMKLAK